MMHTACLVTSPDHINTRVVERAAETLKAGGLVVIPTETVYGLAANALDAEAVKKIFVAKGRPQDNPLIIHIADAADLPRYVKEVPPEALRLAEAFWPGPLTMILKRQDIIPAVVSAGLDSVAVRMPSHPVAAAIIRRSGVPLAAPSANLSGRPSPTTAAHALGDLDGRVDLIIDGGPCAVGVESTVVSLCGPVPKLLRPGGITPEQLKAVLGSLEIDPAVTHMLKEGARVASPGMKYKHYAPKTHVVLVHGGTAPYLKFLAEKRAAGERCAALCFDGELARAGQPALSYGKQKDARSQAHRLFDALRNVDTLGAEVVYTHCEGPEGVGLAVYNRLLRAAAFDEVFL